ncbi:MAG TPA: hypothetical protein VL157_13580, partial [Gemmatimonadaceae bacterium]|nr:hypothetical protein [Gemmatimonadaceae bacterium]
MSHAIVLRKCAGRFAACYRGFGTLFTPGAASGMSLASIAFGLVLMLAPVVALIALAAIAMHHTPTAGHYLAMSLVTAKS